MVFKKIKLNAAINRLVEEQLYELALYEIENGEIRKGLWAKSIADSGGSENAAKSLYVKYRVNAMKDEAEITEALIKQAESENRKHNESKIRKSSSDQKKSTKNDEIEKSATIPPSQDTNVKIQKEEKPQSTQKNKSKEQKNKIYELNYELFEDAYNLNEYLPTEYYSEITSESVPDLNKKIIEGVYKGLFGDNHSSAIHQSHFPKEFQTTDYKKKIERKKLYFKIIGKEIKSSENNIRTLTADENKDDILSKDKEKDTVKNSYKLSDFTLFYIIGAVIIFYMLY